MIRNIGWKKLLSLVLALVLVIGLVPSNVFSFQTHAVESDSEETNQTKVEHTVNDGVACILKDGECGGTHYTSLQAAINAATAGDTIKLVGGTSENVTISKAVIIDGQGFTLGGTVNLAVPNSDKTMKFVNVVFETANTNGIYLQEASYNVTFDHCTFKGAASYTFEIPAGTTANNFQFINACEVNMSSDFMQISGTASDMLVDGMHIVKCGNCFKVNKCANAITFNNVTVDDAYIFIYGMGYGNMSFVIKNCDITAAFPFVRQDKAVMTYTYTFKGENKVAAKLDSTAPVTATQYDGLYIVNGGDMGSTVTWNAPAPAYVAMIGEQGYETLQAAMEEANKAAGTYTITLLSDIAESFSFAQNAGVNITIDGEGKSYTGTITLSGSGNLNFTDTKVIAPEGKNGTAILLNVRDSAPDITFDSCILTLEGEMNFTSIIFADEDANNNVIFRNCTAYNLSYLVNVDQTGFKSITVEDTTATGMASLLKSNKCTNITISNVTCEATAPLQVKASNETTLTLENVNFKVMDVNYAVILMSAPDSGVSELYTIQLKGQNTIVNKNGVALTNENFVMTQDASRCIYKIVDLNFKPVVSVDGVMYGTWDAAKSAIKNNSEIKLYADIEINSGYMFAQNNTYYIDLNGKHLSGPSVTMYFNTKLYITDSVGGGKITGFWIMSGNTTFKVPANAEFEGQLQINAYGQGHFYIGDTCWIGYGNDDAVFYTNNATERIHFKNGYLSLDQEYGNLILMKDLSTLPMQQITIRVGTTLTVSENVTLTLDATTELIIKGTFISKGTVVVNSAKHLKQIMETNELVNGSETPELNNKIVLGSDIEIDALTVYSNVTLDLNGRSLAVQKIKCVGHIIDNSKGAGCIKIDPDGLEMYVDNPYLPLYDTNCYRFFEYKLALLKYQVGENSVTYRFRLKLSTKEAYELLLKDNCGVQIAVNLSLGENQLATLEFKHDLLKDYAAATLEQINNGTKPDEILTYFYVTLGGLECLEVGDVLIALPQISYANTTKQTAPTANNVAATQYVITEKHVVAAKPEDKDTTEPEEEKTV